MQQIDDVMLKFISELGYDTVTQMFGRISSGKKLRSKLILKIAQPSEKVYKLCAVIELIHLASLLHDDVIDDATLRRGEPSINAVFGTKKAIMLGDILYSKGFFELSHFEPRIAKIVSNAVSKLSIGELMDVQLSENFNTDVEKYMAMIYNKTAVLIEASAVCGAILDGHDEEEFSIYGRNLGLAFQIIDDVLDVTQNSVTLGKPALNDFAEGKMTLPYIYLYESLDNANKDRLKGLYKKQLNKQDELWLRQNFKDSGAISRAINFAKELGDEALNAIKEYKNLELENIIKSMINREF